MQISNLPLRRLNRKTSCGEVIKTCAYFSNKNKRKQKQSQNDLQTEISWNFWSNQKKNLFLIDFIKNEIFEKDKLETQKIINVKLIKNLTQFWTYFLILIFSNFLIIDYLKN